MKFILGFPKLISRDINDLFSLTEDAKFTPSSLVKLQYVVKYFGQIRGK